jgi:hypothetical protein
MANSPPDDELPDPALVRVQVRLRRLMLIAAVTLSVGLLAVFGALLYRIVGFNATQAVVVPAPAPATATVAEPVFSRAELGLPADAVLADTVLDGTTLVLVYVHSGGNTLIIINTRTNTVTGKVDLPQ